MFSGGSLVSWVGSLLRVTCQVLILTQGLRPRWGEALARGVLGLPDLTCLHSHLWGRDHCSHFRKGISGSRELRNLLKSHHGMSLWILTNEAEKEQ